MSAEPDYSQPRKIIHVDMDAFFAAVEERDFPEYQGKPLAVGGSPQRRGVICTANYIARRYGVRSALSSYRAMQLCPDLRIVFPRFEAYQSVSRQIRAIFAEVTDVIEPLSLDEAYLDVTQNKLGRSSATHLAQYIKRRILEETGLTASAGVSYNKFLAKVASDYQKPNGLCVIPPTQAVDFIARLPIGKFYGIGKKTEPRLIALGLHTGADLRAVGFEEMQRLFGKSAGFYYGLSRGIDTRPVETTWVRKSIGAETTFAEDLSDRAEMMQALAPLAEEITDWLTRHNTVGHTLTLKVKYADFQQITRSRTVSEPLNTVPDMLALAEILMTTTEAGARQVRLLGLSLSKLSAMESAMAPKLLTATLPDYQLKIPLALNL